MRTGVHQHQCIHLEAQGQTGARRRVIHREGHVAVFRDIHAAEPVHVGCHVAPAEAVLAEFDEEAVAAVAVVVVARFLVVAGPPLARDNPRIAGSARRVVPADAVGRDRAEDPSHVRIEAVSRSQLESVLALQRVRQIEPLQRIGRVVEQHADVAATLDVGEFERCSTPRQERPVSPAGQCIPIRVGVAHSFSPLCGSRARPLQA